MARPCEPCNRKGKHVSAAKWCTQCDEALCPSCYESHRSMKALLSHRIIDIDTSKVTTVSAVMKPSSHLCRKHTDLKLDYFCLFHDVICCQTCVSQYHRTCAKVIPIDVAAKGIKDARNTKELLSQLENIHGTLDGMRERKLLNIKQIEDQEVAIRTVVSNIKQKVIERLNVLEKEIFDELLNLRKAGTSKLQREERKIMQTENLVLSHKEQLEFELQHGSDKQTFIAAHLIKNHIIGIEEKIMRIKSRSGMTSLVFRENGDIPESLTSLGAVTLSSNSKMATFQPEIEFNNTNEDKERFIQGFDFHHKFDVSSSENVMITGIASTDDNRLLLCGGGKSNIIVCNHEGKYLQDCKLAGEPWDVAITQERDGKAVATLPYLYAIQFINMNSMAAGKMVKFDWRVYGIASIQRKVIVGGRSNLHILDTEGNKLNDIAVPSISVFYIHPRENGDYYYSDNSYVYCIKPDGRHIFCQDFSRLESPRNIVTDNRGNLYIAGHRSENLHRLSSSGISLDIPLSKEDGIKGPFAICFSKDERVLFVSNNSGKTIMAYKTIYAPPSREAEIQDLLRYLHD